MAKTSEESPCNGAEQEQHDADQDHLDDDAAAKEKLTDGDPSKVKFTSVNLDGKNGDAKIDIHVAQKTVGMGKDELMKYANEPFWVRLRMILFIFFWLAWVGMLVGAIGIIITAPRCPPPPKVEWFQKAAFVQVDVETFKDSDGNGIGDFKGIASKIDYFKDHHIDAVMLSAFYQSGTSSEFTSDADEYGIQDHRKVDERFGSLADFEDLAKQLRENGIRLVIDFNPNHSSDLHPWFTSSVENQPTYKDFYVWADPESGPSKKPPNNWLNVHGDSAWIWKEERQQYYLATFGENFPDYNLRNELVKQELRETMKFWVEKGVDGFKVVAASHLIEDSNLRDEPAGTLKGLNKKGYKDVDHIFTLDQPENLELFADWKETLLSSGLQGIFMPELSGSLNATAMYYGNESFPLAELPFTSYFTDIRQGITGFDLKHYLEVATDVPSNGWPTLLVGSKSTPRLASRVGDDLVDAIHMISTLSKGTPIMYYGDELGLPNFTTTFKSSNPQTVMLWNNESYSGFTNGSTSLHVHPNYPFLNVQVQESRLSHLKVFSRLLALRSQPAVNFGLQQYPVVTNETFSLLRVRKGSPGYLVVVNLGKSNHTIDFKGKSNLLPETARVEVRSSNIVEGPLADGDHPKVPLSAVPLFSKQAVVLSFVPTFEG